MDQLQQIIPYLEKVKNLSELKHLVEQLPGGAETAKIAGQIVIVAAVIALILALLQCFFGYKMLRFWVALIGFALGSAIGSGIIANIMENPSKVLIVLVGITAGAFLGILAFKLYVVGVFIYCGLLGAAIVMLLPFDKNESLKTVQIVLMVIVYPAEFMLRVHCHFWYRNFQTKK